MIVNDSVILSADLNDSLDGYVTRIGSENADRGSAATVNFSFNDVLAATSSYARTATFTVSDDFEIFETGFECESSDSVAGVLTVTVAGVTVSTIELEGTLPNTTSNYVRVRRSATNAVKETLFKGSSSTITVVNTQATGTNKVSVWLLCRRLGRKS